MLRQSIKMRGASPSNKNQGSAAKNKKSVKYSKLPEEIEDEKIGRVPRGAREEEGLETMIGTTAFPRVANAQSKS
jgi:hypothetical protein